MRVRVTGWGQGKWVRVRVRIRVSAARHQPYKGTAASEVDGLCLEGATAQQQLGTYPG